MAVYGKGQMIGSMVDPRLMQVDYTPIINAGAIQGQAYANLGETIGGAITTAADYLKQQKEQIKSVDTASRIAGLLESKAPDLVPGISDIKMQLDDQELPLSQRIASAESLFTTMKIGSEVNQMINQNQMMQLRQQKAMQSMGGGSGGRPSSATQSTPVSQAQGINPFTGQPY